MFDPNLSYYYYYFIPHTWEVIDSFVLLSYIIPLLIPDSWYDVIRPTLLHMGQEVVLCYARTITPSTGCFKKKYLIGFDVEIDTSSCFQYKCKSGLVHFSTAQSL